MRNGYKSVLNEATVEYITKKSRFIATVKPIAEEEQALEHIKECRTRYWDATHNVYAYIVKNGNIQRYSDDGEPRGTAGIPVLEVLIKQGFADVLVVITRYFGGIMLGAGGLVRAYTHTAGMGILAAGCVDIQKCYSMKVMCSYAQHEKISRTISQNGGNVEKTEYGDGVVINFVTPIHFVEEMKVKLTEALGFEPEIELTEEIYRALVQ